MKYTYFSIILYSILLHSCFLIPDTRPRAFWYPKNCSYFPVKDTINLGDTIWIKTSIPNHIENEYGLKYDFNNDNINADVIFDVYKYNDTNFNYLNKIGQNNSYQIFNKIGKRIEYSNFNFIYNQQNDMYENEFGFILNDTGKYEIACSNYSNIQFFIDEKIRINGRLCYYMSTFKETDSGFFRIYVKP